MKATLTPSRRTSAMTRPLTATSVPNGFTLIEILLVMAIFSIGILAIMTLHITAINSNAKARRMMTGSIIMADRFEKLISADYHSARLNPGEKTSHPGNGFVVEHAVTATPIPNIKRIDLTVFVDADTGRSIHVAYYKRRPE